MTIVRTEDNRNIEWRKNNVGANLLQKMGWKEGDGIGKRGTSSATALRALKRQDGLGLGAKMANEGGQSESTNHFAKVLSNLQAHHAPTTSSKKKSKKNKKKKSDEKSLSSSSSSSEDTPKGSSLVLPQNKVVAGHAKKRRNAKFGEKSAEELACIFGNTGVLFESIPAIKESGNEKSVSKEKQSSSSSSKKRSKSDDSEEKREKKRRKKEKKEKPKKKELSSS